MLVSACIVLTIAVHCHAKKTNDTCFYTHIPIVPAWNHVWRVEKNALPTPKQAPEKVATPKSSRLQLQSCGTLQTATPT
jgi:hypothetical protein